MSKFITDIANLQNAGLPVDFDTDLEVIDRHFIDSENEFLKPVLGTDLFDAAVTGLADETPAAKWTDLLPYLQAPVAYNGFYRFTRIPGGQLTHKGLKRNQSQYTTDAPKWEHDQLKDTLICGGDHRLDELIKFLQDNVDTYTEWKTSSFFDSSIGSIIPSAEVFDQYVKIGCSGRVFSKLAMYRRWAEKGLIRVICQPLYDRIIAEQKGETPITPAIEDLMDYVRPLVAFDTMARGIKKLNFNYTDSGIYTYSYSDGTLTKTAISFTECKGLAEEWRRDYDEARADLLAFLDDNIDDYPEYANSDCYKDQADTLVVQYDNDITKKHFGL